MQHINTNACTQVGTQIKVPTKYKFFLGIIRF